MWTVLPFEQQDQDWFYNHGFSKEFVAWMTRKHDPDKRHCLVSENITNAAKLGRRIRWHFESNSLYRTLFPETLPNTNCKWTDHSLEIVRKIGGTGGAHGEGTFDFLGVKGALQSRHYNGMVIQDDLVGKKALESIIEMESAIEYHQLLPGAFEDEDKNHEGDELVIGNRWAYHDLNSWMREHERYDDYGNIWFRITSHSALGGCCEHHPADLPIFPQEWTFEKLMKRKRRLGPYLFSCQYLNNPCSPEDADFKERDLRYYEWINLEGGTRVIRRDVVDGIVLKDIDPASLVKSMVVDPNHKGEGGRARHAILVIGMNWQQEYFLLETWAEACNYDKFYNKIYEYAGKWGLRKVGFETIASQRYCAHHIEHLNKVKTPTLKIIELKGEVEDADGGLTRRKEFRIRNVVGPIAEEHRLNVRRDQQDFIAEYITFPKGKFVDQLDCFAYAPQLLRKGTTSDPAKAASLLAANARGAKEVNRPYSMVQ